jgi:hypothetical protein
VQREGRRDRCGGGGGAPTLMARRVVQGGGSWLSGCDGAAEKKDTVVRELRDPGVGAMG